MRVILAGATGWAGSEIARGIARSADLQLVAAVARTAAGQTLGSVLGEPALSATVHATAASALATPCDVFVEFTRPDSAKGNILAVLSAGAHVVLGTRARRRGLCRDRRRRTQAWPRRARVRHFAPTVVLLQRFAETAARYLDHFEVIDYAHEDKPDAPSGTPRELAFRLGQVKAPDPGVPLDAVRGPRAARGATLNGVRSTWCASGLRHRRRGRVRRCGPAFAPHAPGGFERRALCRRRALAIRKVGALTGVCRGLDAVMEW